MIRNRDLKYGVGINDYPHSTKNVGRDTTYIRWCGMLMRCYDDNFKKTRPTYEEATVCEEWLTFSKFDDWCKNQNHIGMHMDKDLIKEGNTVYSPDTVCFIPPELNAFFTDRKRFTSASVGVRQTNTGKFVARVMNNFTGKREHLGTFLTVEAAESVWRKRKCELANQWADLLAEEGYEDRIVSALRMKYSF